jgi:hypothetical protein
MNKQFIRRLGAGCLVGILLLIAWFYWPASKAPASQLSKPSISLTTNASTSPSTFVPSNGTNPVAPSRVDLKATINAERAREASIWSMAFLTPITFYGKILDEKNNPVGGAKVDITAADHFMDQGSGYKRTSDEDGLFSISGIHGMGLVVIVSKEGYYASPSSNGNFGYASGSGELPPHTDPSDPAIFVLRKMGETEPLIVQHIDTNTSKTGAPMPVDFHTGKTRGTSNPDIQVQSWVEDQKIHQNQPYHWRCQITVPGGGLQLRTGGEFDFTAPENGYQSSDEIDIVASDPRWRSSQSREYFLKLANGEYARMSFLVGVGYNTGFTITSYLNPAPGHRNLEYDPAKQINK